MAEATEKKRPSLASRLKVRVNPQWNAEVDPHENEFAYVNPVTLNNDLIRLGNEALTITESSVAAVRANQALRLERKKLERQLEDAEEALLRDEPLTPSEAKSLKTIAAAVARRVKERGEEVAHRALREKIRELEDQMEKHEATIRVASLYWGTIERLSDNIKSHLSFIKHEREASRRGT